MRTIVFWGLYWGPLILGNYVKVSAPRSCRGSQGPLRVHVRYKVGISGQGRGPY